MSASPYKNGLRKRPFDIPISSLFYQQGYQVRLLRIFDCRKYHHVGHLRTILKNSLTLVCNTNASLKEQGLGKNKPL